jgi:hypothetical protein
MERMRLAVLTLDAKRIISSVTITNGMRPLVCRLINAATISLTALTDQTNAIAPCLCASLPISHAKMVVSASRPRSNVMASTIAETYRTRKIAPTSPPVSSISSVARTGVSAYRKAGSVTALRTASMVRMNRALAPFRSAGRAISSAEINAASQRNFAAITTMIVGIIPTKRIAALTNVQ